MGGWIGAVRQRLRERGDKVAEPQPVVIVVADPHLFRVGADGVGLWEASGKSAGIDIRGHGTECQQGIGAFHLLSNHFLKSRTAYLSFLGSMGSLFRVPRSEIRALLELRQEYLQAAFAAIDERYGSFDAYLREGLGLDEATLSRLRLAMLE